MPKRGGNNGGNFRRNRGGGAWNGDHQDNRYNEHDNRDRTSKVQRRVSFKPTNNRQGGHGKISDIKIRAQFEDGDDDMGHIQSGSGHNSRGNFTKGRGFRRRGSPIPGRSGGFGGPVKKLERGQFDWFAVRIPYGAKYDKNFILKSLTDCVAPIPLITYFFGKDEKTQSIFFFVDDDRLAEALLRADRKVTLPNGFKMLVNVRSDVPRVPPLDEAFKQSIKMAMVKRYNKDTNALNLEKFYCDPDLMQTFCPLFRPQIMMAVIDIIADNIPGLTALNLNNNKLIMMDHFKNLAEKLPHLSILYLKQNKINNFSSLDNLKGLPLTELVLENNPIRDRAKDESNYISEVRNRFRKLVKLDEKVLPPMIGFDVESEIKLPTARASFLCNHNGAEIVRQFLEQYFLIFDSGNRQPLLDAYHEHAMFSMTANPTQHPVNLTRLNAYCSASRNLLQTRDNNFRVRALKYGRLQVVSFLSELPVTKHDPLTFVVDLTLFTPVLLCLTVTGVFKECRPSSNSEHFRSFQRTLVIVPAGSGFCIRNEVLHINFASSIQEKFAFKAPPPSAPVVQMAPQPVMHSGGPLPTIVETPTAGIVMPDDTTKMQMVQAMCTTSQMNAEWSRKCLEEHQWDYQRAGETFTRLHSQNKIPPEAFVK